MAKDVREVGNAILKIAWREGLSLSNLPFNKIVYFAHAWYLAQHGEPLIDSEFEAWQFGPVHPQIYRQFRQYGDQPITGLLTRIDLDTGRDVPVEVNLEESIMSHLDRMTRFYGDKTAYWLVQKTHEPGAPWDQVWTASETKPVPGMTIPDAVTEAYYREILRRRV